MRALEIRGLKPTPSLTINTHTMYLFYKSITMLRLIVCLSVISLTLGQTGTNYQTGDGHSRSESVDPEGNVKGQYSYVDPTGKTISVKYSAGKNGFQVEGDHIPRGAGLQAPTSLQSAPYQVPTGPRDFPPYQPTAQDGQYQPYNQGPAPQYNQQGLFAPSGPTGFGQAASQGQISQYSQEQAAQLAEAQRAAAQQYTQPPTPQYSQQPQVPASTQYSDPSQYSPQQVNREQFTPSAPQQFTQEQLAQLSQNQAVQQQLAELSRAQNGQKQLTQEQLIQLSQQQQAGQPQFPQQQLASQPQYPQQQQAAQLQTAQQQQDSQAQLAQRQQLALLVQQQQAQIAQQRASQAEYRPQEASQPQLTQQQLAQYTQQQGAQPQLAQFNQQQQQFSQYTPQQIAQLRQAGVAASTHRFGTTGAASPEQGAAFNYQ